MVEVAERAWVWHDAETYRRLRVTVKVLQSRHFEIVGFGSIGYIQGEYFDVVPAVAADWARRGWVEIIEQAKAGTA
ncbi:MAG TPA: hypothetical protein VD994_12285 [Prosthecobacter sp.]|nr:hypothetical protein [Prosthecobacter sp.]